MMLVKYRHFTLSAGVGYSQSPINAFDRALISAGISDYNLVKISSILPPNCSQEEMVVLDKGLLLPTAFTYMHADTVGMQIAASVAVGIPEDSSNIGVIMKYCGHMSKKEAESLARSCAIQAMNDRRISIKTIVSVATESIVETPEDYCVFAAASLW